MYSEILKTKTEAIEKAVKMSKQSKNGFMAHIVWNAETYLYFVMGKGDTTAHNNEVIIGSYMNGVYIS